MGEKVLRKVFQRNRSETSGFSSASYAFGSQGIYTKMFSGLNLEQQLLIGGAGDITYTVTTKNGRTTYKIVEKYYLGQDSDVYYEVETLIGNEIANFLTSYIATQDFITEDEVQTSSNSYPFITNITEAPSNTIAISLYTVKKDGTRTKTKMKYIVFSIGTTAGTSNISEVVVLPSQESSNTLV